MLKLNLSSAKALANTRVSKNIAFPGLVCDSRKASFSVPPILAEKLNVKDGDSLIIVSNDDVVNGQKVTKFYMAKGKTYKHVYGADGQPLRQEGINKYQYEPNTGVGTILRLNDAKMLKASNGAAWNHLNGSEGKVVKYNVSDVMETTLPTGFEAGLEQEFDTLVVEILLDTRVEAKGVVRAKGGAKTTTATTVTPTADVEVDADEEDAFDDDEEAFDDEE